MSDNAHRGRRATTARPVAERTHRMSRRHHEPTAEVPAGADAVIDLTPEAAKRPAHRMLAKPAPTLARSERFSARWLLVAADLLVPLFYIGVASGKTWSLLLCAAMTMVFFSCTAWLTTLLCFACPLSSNKGIDDIVTPSSEIPSTIKSRESLLNS